MYGFGSVVGRKSNIKYTFGKISVGVNELYRVDSNIVQRLQMTSDLINSDRKRESALLFNKYCRVKCADQNKYVRPLKI